MRAFIYLTLALSITSGCAEIATAPTARTVASAPRLSVDQLLELATVLQQRGDTQRAEQYYLAALDRGADERRVLPHLLSTYIRDRQYRLAAQRAEDHLRKHPNDLTVRVLLAALYQAIADYNRAVAEYTAVVRADDARADAHFALATILSEHGHDRAAADEHFRRYLALAPNGVYAERAQASLMTELEP
jgi:tetratricopeptide (TPR) repeat protein